MILHLFYATTHLLGTTGSRSGSKELRVTAVRSGHECLCVTGERCRRNASQANAASFQRMTRDCTLAWVKRHWLILKCTGLAAHPKVFLRLEPTSWSRLRKERA